MLVGDWDGGGRDFVVVGAVMAVMVMIMVGLWRRWWCRCDWVNCGGFDNDGDGGGGGDGGRMMGLWWSGDEVVVMGNRVRVGLTGLYE